MYASSVFLHAVANRKQRPSQRCYVGAGKAAKSDVHFHIAQFLAVPQIVTSTSLTALLPGRDGLSSGGNVSAVKMGLAEQLM